MQNDTWLTDTLHPDCCPLCSQPLVGGSNICPSCGFTAHKSAHNLAAATDTPTARRVSPATPIPARASALRAQHASGGPSRRSAVPQRPGPRSASSAERTAGWQHESPSYEAASSLSALSLIIAETPTEPPRTTRRLPPQTGKLEHIDEIDTLPQFSGELEHIDEIDTAPQFSDKQQVVQATLSATPIPPFDDLDALQRVLTVPPAVPTLFPAFDEIDTLPEPTALSARAVSPVSPETRASVVDTASWGVSANLTRARSARLLEDSRPQRRRQLVLQRFTLLDRARWWLVRPGRIEFLCWLVGAILLFALTFLLALIIVLSLPLPGRGNFPTSATPVSPGVSSVLPTSTPDAGVTPTISPTGGTPPGTPGATVTVAQGNDASSPSPTTTLNTGTSLFARLNQLNPLVWVIGLCYFLSLFLMGMAGVLRRRR